MTIRQTFKDSFGDVTLRRTWVARAKIIGGLLSVWVVLLIIVVVPYAVHG